MAELGLEVVGVDIDAHKIEQLSAGKSPIYELDRPEIQTSALASGRRRFMTDIAEAAGTRVHFIGVGTPQKPRSHAVDLSYVDTAVQSLLQYLTTGNHVVGKSTVPIGTAVGLAGVIAASGSGASLAWNQISYAKASL